MVTKNDQTGKQQDAQKSAQQDPSRTTSAQYPQGAPEAAHQGRQDYEQTADARRVQHERKRNLEHAKEAQKNDDPKPTGEGENANDNREGEESAPPATTGREG